MTIAVGDVQFRGPYSKFQMLEDRPGVWAVLDGREVPPLAVGSAEDVRHAVESHPARKRWTRRCERPAIAVVYNPLPDRREDLVRRLRRSYELPVVSDGVTLPAPSFDGDGVVALAPREGAEENGDSRVA